MPTVFRHVVNTGIGTTPVDILQISTGIRATVVGLNIANTTDYDVVNVDVKVIDDSSTEGFYVRGLVVPPNTSVKVVTQGEKLILPETAGIRVVSDTENSIDTTVSYVEIS
jgi:hypothetical protein